MSLDRYLELEDMEKVPGHEEMGEFNKTILRCSDAAFRIEQKAKTVK